ncbi:MAG: molybdopterin molybdotransferase MoeA [Chloroflexota bacterium]
MAKQAELLDVEEARRRILEHFHRLPAERVPLSEALGRVLAESIDAALPLPPFANSSMDGFALRAGCTSNATSGNPFTLSVTETVAAGSARQETLKVGDAARIMTGAPLPPGADAVIPFEEVTERDAAIQVFAPVSEGACVRPAGNDFSAGQRLVDAGLELGAPEIALIAAMGNDSAPVVRRPRVAILSTGDELVAPGEARGPGQIYNSNTPMLWAAVLAAGGLAEALSVAADDVYSLAQAMSRDEDCDLLLTSGGASVGDFDHVKTVLGEAGQVDFWRVRIRPGKPLIFGKLGKRPVLGLPGNPTSSMVTFEEFARPAIRAMLGAPPLRPEIEVIVDEPIDNHGGRETYARVLLQRDGLEFHAVLAGKQDSAMLLPLARADGLLRIPSDRSQVHPGDRATVQVWRLPV